MEFPQSLAGKSVKPLCENHQPIADVIPGPLIEISCATCGMTIVMGVESYLELVAEIEGGKEKHEHHS
jgi:hypothetical protein